MTAGGKLKLPQPAWELGWCQVTTSRLSRSESRSTIIFPSILDYLNVGQPCDEQSHGQLRREFLFLPFMCSWCRYLDVYAFLPNFFLSFSITPISSPRSWPSLATLAFYWLTPMPWVCLSFLIIMSLCLSFLILSTAGFDLWIVLSFFILCLVRDNALQNDTYASPQTETFSWTGSTELSCSRKPIRYKS